MYDRSPYYYRVFKRENRFTEFYGHFVVNDLNTGEYIFLCKN